MKRAVLNPKPAKQMALAGCDDELPPRLMARAKPPSTAAAVQTLRPFLYGELLEVQVIEGDPYDLLDHLLLTTTRGTLTIDLTPYDMKRIGSLLLKASKALST